MENHHLSHSRNNPKKKPHHNNGNNGVFTSSVKSATSYDDVFGGPPRFGGAPSLSPRLEDYCEIFSGFNGSSRAAVSSIPVLDLPLVVDDKGVSFDVRRESFDYREVFGAFDGLDFAPSYEELFMQQRRRGSAVVADDGDSSDDAWTPEEEVESVSGKSPSFSNGRDSYDSIDGCTEFNISYHKASHQVNETSISSVAPVLGGYTVAVDEVVGASGRGKVGPSSSVVAFEDKNGDHHYPSEPFVTVSEIGLKTHPTGIPPPSRPPPVLKSDFRRSGSISRSTGSDGSNEGGSPPFFDVEVDASSAAVREAMVKAEAKLKSAKELFEKKREEKSSRAAGAGLPGLKSNMRDKNGSKSLSSQGSVNSDGNEEWEEATQFVELVRTEQPRNADENSGGEDVPFPRNAGFFDQKITWSAKGNREDHLAKKLPKHPGTRKVTSRHKRHEDRVAAEKAPEEPKNEKLRDVELQFEIGNNLTNYGGIVKQRNLTRQEESKPLTENLSKQKKGDRKAAEKSQDNVFDWEQNARKLREALGLSDYESTLEVPLGMHGEMDESETKLKEALRRVEEEASSKEACVKEETEAFEKAEIEKRLRAALEQEEKVKKLKEENERREAEAREKAEEEERKMKEQEEYELRLKEAFEKEEKNRRMREAREKAENERIMKEAREKEENERRRIKEAQEKAEVERRMTETLEREEKERKLRELQEREAYERRAKEALEQAENERKLKEAREKEENEKKLREAIELEEKEKRLIEAFERAETERRLKEELEQEEMRLQEANEREERERTLIENQERQEKEMKQDACEMEKTCETTNEANGEQCSKENLSDTSEEDERVESHEPVNKVLVEEEEEGPSQRVSVSEEACPWKVFEKNLKDASQKEGTNELDAECEKLNGESGGESASVTDNVQGGKLNQKSKTVEERSEDEKFRNGNVGGDQRNAEESKSANKASSRPLPSRVFMEREKEAERLKRELDSKMEHLRKIEEEREREREREKDRMAFDQRALADARERLEKACAEARERSFPDNKALAEARFRAERAAVERATAEARERAAEKAAFEARDRMERSVSDKQLKSSGSFGERMERSGSEKQFQNSASFGASRYQNSPGADGESPQRYTSRLERHRRTADRVAKALAEKNMRDLVTQREQAERTRIAETLDAEVKRWSSGKEGNIRALLSTLQYILGSESGWQPIPLTEVITSAAVKRAYRKATLCVHPDKLQQRGANIHQKYICEKVFDLLKEAWNRFNSEER
ncbi:Chaperone DnaJ-domain superfamily protein [Hirschfeldia incana]|nr:Chaperone DnaJ-domain superfamily protein [Hirschfeldia incana]